MALQSKWMLKQVWGYGPMSICPLWPSIGLCGLFLFLFLFLFLREFLFALFREFRFLRESDVFYIIHLFHLREWLVAPLSLLALQPAPRQRGSPNLAPQGPAVSVRLRLPAADLSHSAGRANAGLTGRVPIPCLLLCTSGKPVVPSANVGCPGRIRISDKRTSCFHLLCHDITAGNIYFLPMLLSTVCFFLKTHC